MSMPINGSDDHPHPEYLFQPADVSPDTDGQRASVSAQIAHEVNHSAVVKLLLARAYIEYMEAIDEFADMDPTNLAAVVACQSKVKRYREMKAWINSALTQGAEAMRRITEEHRTTMETVRADFQLRI